MARSSKKLPYCSSSVLRLVSKTMDKKLANFIIRIRCRGSTILNKFIGLTFGVYNGKSYIPVKVTANMVGRKFGEFSTTRYFPGHSVDKKVVRKK